MNVDRSRFLLLAAALSANACTIIDNRGNTDAAPLDDTSEGADTGAAVDSATEDGAPADAAADSMVADAADATDAADALCTDEGVTVPPCSGMTPSGCDLDALPACTQFPTYFKPRSAKLAIDCVVKLPTCEGTVTDPVWDCAYSALEGGCPDPSLDGYCTTLASSCPGSDAGGDLKSQCLSLAGGLNASGRTRLQALVTGEGGCTTPLRDLLPNL